MTGGLTTEELTPAAFLRLAEEIAREAGDMLLAKRPTMSTRAADIETKSSPTDVVTVLDRASEQLIRERILAVRPRDRILGEEEGDKPGETDFQWHPVCVTEDVSIIQGVTTYPDKTFSNLWIIRFAPDGRCREFTEWWMRHDLK